MITKTLLVRRGRSPPSRAAPTRPRPKPRRRRGARRPPRPAPIRASASTPGMADAGEAAWNLRVVSETPPSEQFVGNTNSDLAFTGNYVIQGNYNGYQVWDISEPGQADARDRVRLPGVAERRLGLQEPAVRLGRGIVGPARLRHAGRAGHGEQRPAPRPPHLRHHRHRPPEVRRQRADLPRLAHAHGGRRSEGQGERLRLHLRLGQVRSPHELPGCGTALPSEDPELGALPHRGHQGSAGASGAGRDRELAADLQRPRGAGQARRDAAGHRRGQAHGGLGPRGGRLHGDHRQPGDRAAAATS